VRCVVVDTAVPGSPEAKAGGARELAHAARAERVPIADLTSDALLAP
jgi:hypothetical protein